MQKNKIKHSWNCKKTKLKLIKMSQTLETLINGESKIITMETTKLQTPIELKTRYPITDTTEKTVYNARRDISNILSQQDPRFIVITGPCSIDNTDAATEYAQRLKKLSEEVNDKLLLVMRTYFEKPRTTVGWKGLIYDPNQDESYDMQKGLEMARQLLLEIGNIGIPTATEFLNPLITDYLKDCISYGAIGARTSESQTHRELALYLPMPTGFKNTTEGNIKAAIDSVLAASISQTSLRLSENNQRERITTPGNHNAHLILRGGSNGPNYDEQSVQQALQLLQAAKLKQRLIIDCSHANSNKKPENQPTVAINVTQQRLFNPYISGIMLESYLIHGKGNQYGQSKTDGCIDWATTETLIKDIYKKL